MRKLGKILYISATVLVIAGIVGLLCKPVSHAEINEPEQEEQVIEEPVIDNTWDMFIEAIIWQESRGAENAIGDNGLAVGVLQIHPIMVREANRILSLKGDSHRYEYDDRYSRAKSIEIFNIVQEYHNKDRDFDVALRIWNHNHPDSYRKQIMRKYNELMEI